MECPINGCKDKVVQVVKDGTFDKDILLFGAKVICGNETYDHYDNGVLVHKKYDKTYQHSPEEIPFAQFPDPPFSIPKP